MKIKFSHDEVTKMVAAIIVLAAGILIYTLMQNLNTVGIVIKTLLNVLSPFINGFIIAFLLNGLVKFVESRMLKNAKMSAKKKHAFSIFFVYLLLVIFITAILVLIIPQLISSIGNLADNMSSYIESVQGYLKKLFPWFFTDSMMEKISGYWQSSLSALLEYAKNSMGTIIAKTSSFLVAVVNIFVGLFVSAYLLVDKEHFLSQVKKLLYSFFPQKVYDSTLEIGGVINNTFTRYISGQLLDSLILGTACLIGTLVMGMPYAVLISVVITVTNIIPILGPIIGCVPSALIILAVNPLKALIFVIFIIVLQQIDGNFMLPKIVGNSTGLKSFWVMFSIFVGGGLFGIPGMVLSVPVFSVIYYLLGKEVRRRIAIKNKLNY